MTDDDPWDAVDVCAWLTWWQYGRDGWSDAERVAADRVVDAAEASVHGQPERVGELLAGHVRPAARAVVYWLAALLANSPDPDGLGTELTLSATGEAFGPVAELVALARALAVHLANAPDVTLEGPVLNERLLDSISTPVARHLTLGTHLLGQIWREQNGFAAMRGFFGRRRTA